MNPCRLATIYINTSEFSQTFRQTSSRVWIRLYKHKAAIFYFVYKIKATKCSWMTSYRCLHNLDNCKDFKERFYLGALGENTSDVSDLLTLHQWKCRPFRLKKHFHRDEFPRVMLECQTLWLFKHVLDNKIVMNRLIWTKKQKVSTKKIKSWNKNIRVKFITHRWQYI